MSRRNQSPVKGQQPRPCSGSGQPPIERCFQVGICRDCGVRTFLNGGLIQTHKATGSDIREFAAMSKLQIRQRVGAR